jgi:hypothetical protein
MVPSTDCKHPNDGLIKTETCGGVFFIYFNVNFNVLKHIYCALVGVIKDWISQNARYNCEKRKNSTRN